MSAVSIIGSRRHERQAIEREKLARLEAAEEVVRDFTARAQKATEFLETRRQRNHWRETIERMIAGRR